MFTAYRKRRALKNIRAAMAGFGYPVDGLTDDELATSIQRAGEAFKNAGVTVAEAQAGMLKLAAICQTSEGA